VHYLQKRLRDAEREYRTAAELDETDPSPHFNLANLLASDRREVEAEQSYRVAIRLEPTNGAFHSALARLYEQMKRYAAAEFAYSAALKIRFDATDQAGLVRARRLKADEPSNP
jgi:Flp pilus assembly protein TadD